MSVNIKWFRLKNYVGLLGNKRWQKSKWLLGKSVVEQCGIEKYIESIFVEGIYNVV